MELSNLLTAEELAERLSLRPSTVKLWARQGFIPAIRITPKVLRFQLADVEEALCQKGQRQEKCDA